MFWGSTVYKHFQLSPFAALTAAFLISSSGLIDIDQTTKNFYTVSKPLPLCRCHHCTEYMFPSLCLPLSTCTESSAGGKTE